MAGKDSTTKDPGNDFDLDYYAPIFNAILAIKDDPEKLGIIKQYLDVLKAKREGRLTPEGVQRLEGFNELINCIHQLYCEHQELNPEQVQGLRDRIQELSGIAPEPPAAGEGGAA